MTTRTEPSLEGPKRDWNDHLEKKNCNPLNRLIHSSDLCSTPSLSRVEHQIKINNISFSYSVFLASASGLGFSVVIVMFPENTILCGIRARQLYPCPSFDNTVTEKKEGRGKDVRKDGDSLSWVKMTEQEQQYMSSSSADAGKYSKAYISCKTSTICCHQLDLMFQVMSTVYSCVRFYWLCHVTFV